MKDKCLPRVSVIIPAYFSFSTLAASLHSLRRQTFQNFEIIIINSSPEEKTAGIVRECCPEAIFIQSPVRLLPHAARNVGVELSQGEFLVFTDPDCEADREWLQTLVTVYDSGEEVLVGAMGLADTSWLGTGIHLCKYHWLLPWSKASLKQCAPTANAAYSRRVWQMIGPFPGDVFAGDGIVSQRAIRLGHIPLFVPEAITLHHHNESLKELSCQRFSRGREYAIVQIRDMGKDSALDWLRLAFSWATIGLVLLRAGSDAFRAGWGRAFLKTLPVQAIGHWLWAIGESWGILEVFIDFTTKRREKP